MTTIRDRLRTEVVEAGICTGCGACAGVDASGASRMEDTPLGPRPRFEGADLPPVAWRACPGKGIDYPSLYRAHYGRLPDDWLLGVARKVRTGHSADPRIRAAGASGGVLSHVLVHLLGSRRIDAAIVVRQGIPSPLGARVTLARTTEEVLAAAQSVYVPVSVLDVLSRLNDGESYAMTCLPHQAASLRVLQAAGHAAARRVRYVLGPYTGTALYPAAIRSYLRSKRVADDDPVVSLRWRAGDWPGYLEIETASGRRLRSPKVYYNFLIPFFITQTSLQEMDFTNEFADLAVGDAWAPRFEDEGGGHSVIVTRSEAMEAIVGEMEAQGLLVTRPEDPRAALDMHGHMLDFKKRGGYLRNRMRRRLGRPAPDFGIEPVGIGATRVAVELAVSLLFLVGGTRVARAVVERLPERVIGPLFDRLRLAWKNLSKPTKRRGLAGLEMRVRPTEWTD